MSTAASEAGITVPDSAGSIFGTNLGVAVRYAEILSSIGIERGLIGPGEAPNMWARHILNCSVIGELIPPDARVADIGSGAGLPGVVLAIARPDLSITCIEPLLRRATFLAEVVDELGLEQVQVVRQRAEDLRGSTFDVVTARAVAPLDRLLPMAAPLLHPGGSALAMKGARAVEELEAVTARLPRWGFAGADVTRAGAGLIDQPATVVRARKRDRTTAASGGSR